MSELLNIYREFIGKLAIILEESNIKFNKYQKQCKCYTILL